jgi:hypothetical protein
MVGGKLIAVAIAASLFSGSAMADPPTGSRLGSHTRPGPKLTEKDQAIGAKQMASCLYNRKTWLVQSVLLAPSKAAQDQAIDRLMGEVTCFNAIVANDMVEERRVTYSPEVLRGMLAEKALEKEERAVAGLAAMALQPKYERGWFSITGRHPTVDEMGACIAETNPAGIATLVRTEPLSKAEAAAFTALQPSLGKCLRAGTRLQANRQSLRAALADALYQRVHAQAPPSVEAAKQ